MISPTSVISYFIPLWAKSSCLPESRGSTDQIVNRRVRAGRPLKTEFPCLSMGLRYLPTYLLLEVGRYLSFYVLLFHSFGYCTIQLFGFKSVRAGDREGRKLPAFLCDSLLRKDYDRVSNLSTTPTTYRPILKSKLSTDLLLL